jgi:dTDP-4-dehydrorhamnose 3,5-epimerase
MIQDVIVKSLKTHSDDRGFFREIIRCTDALFAAGFGQWSHSLMFANVIKAWHYHQAQTDWWYVATGVLWVGLYDMREDSPTHQETMDFLMGDYQAACVVKIPPGVVHGCKTVQGPVNLFYVTSHVYNPDDEYRLPFDDPTIGFDWFAGPTIK